MRRTGAPCDTEGGWRRRGCPKRVCWSSHFITPDPGQAGGGAALVIRPLWILFSATQRCLLFDVGGGDTFRANAAKDEEEFTLVIVRHGSRELSAARREDAGGCLSLSFSLRRGAERGAEGAPGGRRRPRQQGSDAFYWLCAAGGLGLGACAAERL